MGDDPTRPERHDADASRSFFVRYELSERLDRILGDDVSRRAIPAAAAQHGGDVPEALLFHVGQDVLGAQERAAQVGADHLVPERLVHVDDLGPPLHAPVEMGHDAGVVHQDIDVPELFIRLGH